MPDQVIAFGITFDSLGQADLQVSQNPERLHIINPGTGDLYGASARLSGLSNPATGLHLLFEPIAIQGPGVQFAGRVRYENALGALQSVETLQKHTGGQTGVYLTTAPQSSLSIIGRFGGEIRHRETIQVSNYINQQQPLAVCLEAAAADEPDTFYWVLIDGEWVKVYDYSTVTHPNGRLFRFPDGTEVRCDEVGIGFEEIITPKRLWLRAKELDEITIVARLP